MPRIFILSVIHPDPIGDNLILVSPVAWVNNLTGSNLSPYNGA